MRLNRTTSFVQGINMLTYNKCQDHRYSKHQSRCLLHRSPKYQSTDITCAQQACFRFVLTVPIFYRVFLVRCIKLYPQILVIWLDMAWFDFLSQCRVDKCKYIWVTCSSHCYSWGKDLLKFVNKRSSLQRQAQKILLLWEIDVNNTSLQY